MNLICRLIGHNYEYQKGNVVCLRCGKLVMIGDK